MMISRIDKYFKFHGIFSTYELRFLEAVNFLYGIYLPKEQNEKAVQPKKVVIE